jgi:small conductance mechanosensitive channel
MKSAFELLTNRLFEWYESFVVYLPNLMVAMLLMVLFIYASQVVKRLSKSLIAQFTKNTVINNFITSIVHYAFLVFGMLLVLSVLQLDRAVTSILAGAGVLGLAIGLAFQNPIKNTVSGFIMSYRDFYRIGDWIETNGYYGFVEKIGVRVSHIRLTTGELLVLPNDTIVANPFKNVSIDGRRAVVLDVGISYGDDLEKVEKVVIETIREQIDHIKGVEPEVYFQEFGDSSINFMLRFWIDKVEEKRFLQIRSDAIKAIKKAFDKNGITIPFPIRTLDFGIKGGRQLSEMLNKKPS